MNEPTLGDRIETFFRERVTSIDDLVQYQKMGVGVGNLLANLLLHFIAAFEVMVEGFVEEYGGMNEAVDKDIEKMESTIHWAKMVLIHEDSQFPIDAELLMTWTRNADGRSSTKKDLRHTLHLMEQFSEMYSGITDTTRLIQRDEDELPPSFFAGVALLHYMSDRSHDCHCPEFQTMQEVGVNFEAISQKVEDVKMVMDNPSVYLEEKHEEELAEGKDLRPNTLDVLNGARLFQN